MNKGLLYRLAVSGVACLLIAGGTQAGPMHGSVHTSDADCSGTDLNIYESKDAVYLDGGPGHPGSAGLPDGLYAVQVTDPDGSLLGSTVGSINETPVLVIDGEFAQCYQLSAILIRASDGTLAGYDSTQNPGGEYKVWVSKDSTFANNETKTDNFKVKKEEPPPVDPRAVLEVHKFYDANANGAFDGGELFLDGWKISIVGTVSIIRFTPVDALVDAGTYVIAEELPVEPSWIPTTAISQTVTVGPNDFSSTLFGNVCVGAGGGLTIGFWSNKNGQGLTTSAQLCALNGLNLRNAAGANFDPAIGCPSPTTANVNASKTAFRTWLLSANAVNMAYMLSAQMAAMVQNVANGNVSPNAMIYAPDAACANAAGFASVQAVINEANASLLTAGYTVAAGATRTYQEGLKNILDAANNNKNFAQATPCAFSFAE